MPRNLDMASGLIVGFASGAGGLGVTVLRWVADHGGGDHRFEGKLGTVSNFENCSLSPISLLAFRFTVP